MREQAIRLKPFLEEVYRRYHTTDSLVHDPLSFPRRYTRPDDIEVSAMIAASFAFGRVAAFMPVVERLLERMGEHPADALLSARDADIDRFAGDIAYRFVTPDNTVAMLSGIGSVLAHDGTLKVLFAGGYGQGGTVSGLQSLSSGIRFHAAASGRGDPGFLMALGRPGSPMKRLCMFLRWMVRDDGIDTGLWRDIPARDLLFPLDVHVVRISRLLGLLPAAAPGAKQRAPSMKDSIMLTDCLRHIDPDDPVRFDFAISHLGISGGCTGVPCARCDACPLAAVCACRN